jgi:hypothetical protein
LNPIQYDHIEKQWKKNPVRIPFKQVTVKNFEIPKNSTSFQCDNVVGVIYR